MKISLTDFLNLFLFLAGVICLLRFKRTDKTFYPFFYLLWIGCFNEVLSFILVLYGYQTIINNNIYALLEALVIVWFFTKIKLFETQPIVPVVIALLFVAFWLIETFVLRNISEFNPYFRIIYSFAIVLMSISAVNIAMLTSTSLLSNSALFLICIGFIAYFTLSILVNAFLLYGLLSNSRLLLNLHYILITVNFFSNIVYVLASLRIPQRSFVQSINMDT